MKFRRLAARVSGAITGAMGGVGVASEAIPLIFVDPTGSAATYIGGAAVIGAIGGFLGADVIVSDDKGDDDDENQKQN